MNIKEAVANKIANSGTDIANRVINVLVEEVLNKRVVQITSAYTELDKLNRDIRRYKPDVVTYQEDGSIATSTYSKAKFDEKKAMSDRIAKLSKAIDSALDENNWDLIAKLGDKNTNESNKDS